ncbi:hypothetical protein CH063_10056, partial [Colletotrichum higginsianum]
MLKKYFVNAWKVELEARAPTWYCAIRKTRIDRPQVKRNNVRKPAGPMGNQDQKSKGNMSVEELRGLSS